MGEMSCWTYEKCHVAGGHFQGDVGDVQIISSSGAFALLKTDGSVTAFGDTDAGGDCSAVQVTDATVKR